MLHLVLGGLLLLFNAGSTVFNQMAIRADGGKMAWSPAISASTTEAFKLAVALVFLVRALATASTDKSGKSSVNMPTDFMFCVKYAVPGLLYALCNVLNYRRRVPQLHNFSFSTTSKSSPQPSSTGLPSRRLKIYQWRSSCCSCHVHSRVGWRKRRRRRPRGVAAAGRWKRRSWQMTGVTRRMLVEDWNKHVDHTCF